MARRLGLLFGELPIRGETRVAEVEEFYGLELRPARAGDHARRVGRGAPRRPAGARRHPARSPAASWWSAASSSGRIASIGLQLDELLQVEPDEKLLERLEAEADELSGLRRWLARLTPQPSRRPRT